MLRPWTLFLMLILILPVPGLFAQEEPPEEERPEPPPIESEWIDYNTNLYSPGDKTFTITLGIVIPTVFKGIDKSMGGHGLSVGGTGTLAFNYFLTSHIFLGGELSGMFARTRGKNMLYMVPFGLRVGYQFVYRRFEFPLSFMIGAAPQKKLEEGYIGLIMKPGASVFWRFNPDWSFGFNAIWWVVPQWPKSQDGVRYNATGNFLELTLSARYHF